MMTGFGFDAHSVQPIIPGMEEECCSRSQFFTGLRDSNSDDYGLGAGCYHQSQCSNVAAPQASTMPRVSISDEELYQALNISPMLLNNHNQSTSMYFPTISPNAHNIASSSSYYCFPSTSSLEQPLSPFENQTMYLPQEIISREQSPAREAASPTFSIHSFAPTTSTANAEEEDLEVELINTTKRDPRNELADDIDIYLHSGTSDTDFQSSRDTTYSESSSSKNPTPSSRPPYAKKLSLCSQKTSIESSSQNVPNYTSPLFLQTTLDPTGFTPLLTPKSDAILQRKLSEATHKPIHTVPTRRESYPVATCSNALGFDYPTPSSFHKQHHLPTNIEKSKTFNKPFDFSSFASVFQPDHQFAYIPSLNSTPEKQSLSRECYYKEHPIVEEETAENLSDIEFDNQSEKIAVNVIENLFRGNPEPPTISVEQLFGRLSRESDQPEQRAYQEADMEQEKAVNKQDEVLDDWETADDNDLAERMEQLLKDVKKAPKKEVRTPTLTIETPTTSNWDPNFLPNVLEICGIPDYKMQDDVIKALEQIGFGDCNVKWIERKIVLASFENVNRAKACLTIPRHEWLRFRTLANSPKSVQDAAKENSAALTLTRRRGQTNASVARRMVENVLGKKSSVSVEKRREERKQITDARAAKKNAVQWD